MTRSRFGSSAAYCKADCAKPASFAYWACKLCPKCPHPIALGLAAALAVATRSVVFGNASAAAQGGQLKEAGRQSDAPSKQHDDQHRHIRERDQDQDQQGRPSRYCDMRDVADDKREHTQQKPSVCPERPGYDILLDMRICK